MLPNRENLTLRFLIYNASLRIYPFFTSTIFRILLSLWYLPKISYSSNIYNTHVNVLSWSWHGWRLRISMDILLRQRRTSIYVVYLYIKQEKLSVTQIGYSHARMTNYLTWSIPATCRVTGPCILRYSTRINLFWTLFGKTTDSGGIEASPHESHFSS